ncbi:MAG: outer membrane lipoprotein-sorting protein [Elusimicrobia bacterium]|nr:outer membrane lipoprotein-sorting protein [Elusimicrobiota bacterium]
MFRAWLVLAAGFALASPSRGAGPTPAEIVARADEVRNPQIDYTGIVDVVSVKPDKSRRTARYEVMVKGRERAVVRTLEPANERGGAFLQAYREVWSFLPSLSQPVRLSLQQRLIGDVANGDLTRANFSGDYEAKLLRQEGKRYVLELSAKNDAVTYAKVVYWVGRKDFHPAKAEFYASSGRLLKICSYERYAPLAGRLRPSRLVMRDAVVKGQRSIVDYVEMDPADLPEKYFTKSYLKKLKY